MINTQQTTDLIKHHLFRSSSKYADVMIPEGNAISAIPTTADIIPMILPVIVTGYTSP